jgi:1-acyl-sn-glycerol-3-phosphate acyltransferase
LPVLFFPEGTTTDGGGVLPFRRGLFHSVLDNGVSLRTAALRYSLDSCRVNGEATVGEDVCWWGEMGFTSHIFGLLGLRGLKAQIRFGEEVVQREDRFVLSETAQERVAEMYAELGGGVSAVAEQPCETALFEAVLN